MKSIYLIILLTALLGACSSGKARLEKGDYDVAVYRAVKRLQQKPNHHKAEKVLREAYLLAVDGHMDKIEYYDNSGSQFKFDKMVNEYEHIQALNNAIRRYPKYANLLKLTEVSNEIGLFSSKAASSHFNKGNELLDLGTKDWARKAYNHFTIANRFESGFVSTKQLDFALQAGTVNVVLEFTSNRRFSVDYNAEHLYEHVYNGFRNSNYKFLRVVEPSEIDFDPDEIIQIEMEEAHIGRVDVSRNVFEMTKEDVYMGEAETDSGEVVKVYGEVTADYIEFCKTINTRSSLYIERINGNNSAVIHRRTIPSSYNWTEKWATYRGDKRALTASQLDFVTRKEPRSPDREWLFAQTTKPLIDNSCNFLRNQYSHLR